MTNNMWMSAPAGALGQGGADARPIGDVTVRATGQPPFAGFEGTGAPTTRLRGLDYGVDVVGTPAASNSDTCPPRGEFIAQHDGTTLGFHSSSRPLS